MGALPKNKITRAEQGMRRRGNRPTLTKNPKHTTVPLHKRGLFATVLNKLGLGEKKSK